MAKVFRWLSVVFFVAALSAMFTLLVSDVVNRLAFTALHRRAGALSFMLIGLAFMCLLLGSRPLGKGMIKEFLLGIAFLFWGSVQFLPATPWAAAMDTAVVLIFVTDLSLIIIERLKSKP